LLQVYGARNPENHSRLSRRLGRIMSGKMDYLAKARRVIGIEADELQRLAERLDGDAFGRAVGALRDCVERRGKVVVCGVGKSGHIGDKIAATLTSTGATAVVLNSLNALHGDLGLVADGDVVLAFSYGGETAELLNILPPLAKFDVVLVAVTGRPDSTLGQAADIVLDVGVSQEACPLNLAPTSSTTAMLALGDALAMVLLEARGFRQEDFARYHPGGSLGRVLLLRVSQIMRAATRLAVASTDETVLEVLKKMTKCRTGAAAVVDADGRLCGVFTHGDLARHYQQHADLGAQAVAAFMTKSPITVRGDKLAAEALHVLKTHSIDDLIVVDEDNRPIGIVDSQDLSRLQGV
jgi:arabinose-5-phosphate isomerase